MKSLLYLVFSLIGLAAGTATAQDRTPASTAVEMAAPHADAEQYELARQQTATLADALLLSPAQARHLQKALYEKLCQGQAQERALAAGQAIPAAAVAAVLRRYYGRLLPVLSPAQYGTLLWLDDSPVAPFAPIAVASRYVPAKAYAFATLRSSARARTGHRF